MILQDGMLLYHGSYVPIEDIDLAKCVQGKDFGKGFYLTSDKGQAARFIRTSLLKAKFAGIISQNQNYGFVTAFRYNARIEIPTFEFEDVDRYWLWFIASNRRANRAIHLRARLPDELQAADIIVGKIANDTTNPVITAFLNGLYGPVDQEKSVQMAISLLLPDRLRDQICFCTKRAVDCLERLEVIRHG